MDKDDITKVPTVDLIKEMTKLDQDIELLMLKYEKVRLELVRRFPSVEETEEFKPKRRV